MRITALDRSPAVVVWAREHTAAFPEVVVREADFFDLARSGETFDYVTASLFLHHVAPGREVEVLRGFDRLARRGVIVSDLSRGHAAYAGVWFLSRLVGDDVVRHDGPLSVRRAFRPEDLSRAAREAGLDYLRVRRHLWFRLSLAGEKYEKDAR
jgi:2-polyprenyl-3-methyl-5-hydroxy-6-metoxy-1,4-benzoquinol methylase